MKNLRCFLGVKQLSFPSICCDFAENFIFNYILKKIDKWTFNGRSSSYLKSCWDSLVSQGSFWLRLNHSEESEFLILPSIQLVHYCENTVKDNWTQQLVGCSQTVRKQFISSICYTSDGCWPKGRQWYIHPCHTLNPPHSRNEWVFLWALSLPHTHSLSPFFLPLISHTHAHKPGTLGQSSAKCGPPSRLPPSRSHVSAAGTVSTPGARREAPLRINNVNRMPQWASTLSQQWLRQRNFTWPKPETCSCPAVDTRQQSRLRICLRCTWSIRVVFRAWWQVVWVFTWSSLLGFNPLRCFLLRQIVVLKCDRKIYRRKKRKILLMATSNNHFSPKTVWVNTDICGVTCDTSHGFQCN